MKWHLLLGFLDTTNYTNVVTFKHWGSSHFLRTTFL
jgi:hypothetical protein